MVLDTDRSGDAPIDRESDGPLAFLLTKPFNAPVDERDLKQAGLLFLGEANAADVGLIGAALHALLGALIDTERFERGTLSLAGSDDKAPAPMSLIRWARGRLGVDVSAYECRKRLLGAALASPPVAAVFADDTLSLSTTRATLRRWLGMTEDGGSDDAVARLQRAASGVTVLGAQNLTPRNGGDFTMCMGDPAVIFSLDPQVTTGPAVEIAFAVAGARKRAEGRLYVDYGGGFSEERTLSLYPDGRSHYAALLASPADIVAIRWDPDAADGAIDIMKIAARALSEAEFAAATETVSWTEGPPANAHRSLSLSRLLTVEVCGHKALGIGDYESWIAAHEVSGVEAGRLWTAQLQTLTARPLISILVPTYETPADLLSAMIESVQAQVYPNWQLCLADDASKSPQVRQIIEAAMAQDERIKAVFRPTNGHISEASNSALDLATGEWLAMLDHDDVLTPDALLCLAMEIEAHPDAACIYSDEDKLNEQGERFEPFFKPDFAPELLRAQNYLNHLTAHRTERVKAAGGWRKGFEGSQDYDLNLRLLETVDPRQVRHIPKVLYHWRAVEGSTALSNDQKSYAFDAGLKALEDHVGRMKFDAQVEKAGDFPFYRVRYALPQPAPTVSLVIPTRDRADLLRLCMTSVLERTDYPSYEVIIVDNGSTEAETFALFETLKADGRVRILPHPGPFNYSRINNAAVEISRGEIVGLLNNDIEVISPGWMTEMVALASLPRMGCVGAKLYYPHDMVQHAGVVLGLGGVAGHSHKHRYRGDPGYFGRIAVSHEVSAVTGACLFVRRSIWDQLGGLNEDLAVAFNDVDFCIRVREAGYTNVFTPFAELYHHESVSRGTEDSPEKQARFEKEVAYMLNRWPAQIGSDPYYSQNLSMVRDDYSIA
jgi:GT2 family glycosyltransferase